MSDDTLKATAARVGDDRLDPQGVRPGGHRIKVKRLLTRCDDPPDKEARAIELVREQVQLFAEAKAGLVGSALVANGDQRPTMATVLPLLGPVVLPRLRAPVLAEPASPFDRGHDERPLRLIIDTEAMQPSPELDALLNICRHVQLEAATTSNSGLWTVRPPIVRSDGHLIAEIDRHDGRVGGPIVRNATTWRTLARNLHADVGGELSELQRRALIVAIARDQHDLIVADDPGTYLPGGPVVVDASTGAALVGLFLRSRGIEAYWYDIAEHRTPLMSQRVVARMGLLDAAHQRWWLGCYSTGRPLTDVAEGLVIRFQRAMRARDEVMVTCLAPRDEAPWDSICYHLDALLVWLSGAFDVTAHVAHSVYGIHVDPWLVGWRRKQWRQELKNAARRLYDLTDGGSPVGAVMDLIAELRNTIHREPIREVYHREARGGETRLLALPAQAHQRAVAASEVLFGEAAWGFKSTPPPTAGLGGMCDPYLLVQMLVPFAAEALKAIMAFTEVERLPGVGSAALDPGPRPKQYDEPILGRLMRLHGFRWTDGALSAQIS